MVSRKYNYRKKSRKSRKSRKSKKYDRKRIRIGAKGKYPPNASESATKFKIKKKRNTGAAAKVQRSQRKRTQKHGPPTRASRKWSESVTRVRPDPNERIHKARMNTYVVALRKGMSPLNAAQIAQNLHP